MNQVVRRAVIAGIGQTVLVRHSDRPDESWLAEAIRLALDDAQLKHQDIDGLAVATLTIPDDSPHLAEHLGLDVRWVLKADYGGASALAAVARAKSAVESGAADRAVVVAGGARMDRLSSGISHDQVAVSFDDYSLRRWVEPYGNADPNAFFGLIQRRHMYEFGTTLEQLAKIAVSFRNNARQNEEALLREPMTVADYMSSPLISDPIRRFDCCMYCSGAVAIVVAAEAAIVASDHSPVYPSEYGESIAYQARSASPSRVVTGHITYRDRLFELCDRADIDFLQLYDDYPIAIIMALEDLGFAPKGQGGILVEETDISPGGQLPINTGGGQLSMGQPGLAGGAIHIVEAVRQLRATAGERQVRDARIGLVSGLGMLTYGSTLAAANAMLLRSEPLR